MTYPDTKNTIRTPLGKAELVRFDGDKLGLAKETLSESDGKGNLLGYVVTSLDKSKTTFFLLASDVVRIPDSEREAEIRKYKRATQKTPKTSKKKAPEPEPGPEKSLAEILATADVGEHDTALSYATELVKQVRKNHGADFSERDNVAALYRQFVVWAKQNDKLITGITLENLMHRIEGELFYIQPDGLHKHAPYRDPKDEAAAIEAGYKKPKTITPNSVNAPTTLAAEYVGKYAYHTTSFINLYNITGTGLLRAVGGSPGGSCFLAKDDAQRDNSIEHSKQVIAAAIGRFTLNTYVNQREDRADKVVGDDNTARNAHESELQSDLDEHAALLRFKITAEHEWVTDPQDSRALLLTNADVAPGELECLTSEGWVPMTALAELGTALQYNDNPGGADREFQVFTRQSQRVLWRLDHEPSGTNIKEGEAFAERGTALLAKLDADPTAHAKVTEAIAHLTEKLSTLKPTPDATDKKD
jgi:hypothetical protein